MYKKKEMTYTTCKVYILKKYSLLTSIHSICEVTLASIRPKESEEEILVIRVDLKGIYIQMFTEIKEFLENKYNRSITNTKVIREALNIAENFNKSPEGSIQIKNEFIVEIHRLLQSPSFRRKYAVTSIDQFIDRSLADFLKTVRDGKKSLLKEPFEVYSELGPTERQVAKTLFDMYAAHEHHLIHEELIVEKLSSSTKYEDIIKALGTLQADGYINYLLDNETKMYWIV